MQFLRMLLILGVAAVFSMSGVVGNVIEKPSGLTEPILKGGVRQPRKTPDVSPSAGAAAKGGAKQLTADMLDPPNGLATAKNAASMGPIVV